MELDDIIKERDSVRKYQDKDVTIEKIGLILEAGRHAPTSGNLQDFRFVIVKEKDIKNKIAEASLKQYWMNSAPIFIVICSDLGKLKTFYKENAENYSLQNSAASAMLISLKAVDLGLSSCWVNIFDQKAVSRILRLPDSIISQIILTIGYQEEKPMKKLSKIPLQRITFFNKYGTRVINLKTWPKEKYINIKEIIKKKLK